MWDAGHTHCNIKRPLTKNILGLSTIPPKGAGALPWLRNLDTLYRKSAATIVAEWVRCWERTARLWRCATVRNVYSNSGTSFPTASNAPFSHASTSATCDASNTPSPAAPIPISTFRCSSSTAYTSHVLLIPHWTLQHLLQKKKKPVMRPRIP